MPGSITEKLKPQGHLVITLISEDGIVKERREVKNLVVDTGKEHIAQRLITTGLPTAMSHMAIGDSDLAPAVGQTTLENQLGSRSAFDSAWDSAASAIFLATFVPGQGTGAVKEAGIFNAAASGTMLARTTFAEVNKAAADTLSIQWTITIT